MNEEERTDRLKLKLHLVLFNEAKFWEAPVYAQPGLLEMLDRILTGKPDEFDHDLWGPTGRPANAEQLLHHIVTNLSVEWQAIPVPAIDIKARHN